MRKGYFVIGPTSTMTRFTSQLIIDQGINGGYGHSQEFQEMLHPMFNKEAFILYCLNKETQLIRCSYPHGLENPHVNVIVQSLLDSNFDMVFVVVTSRSMPSNIMSNINARHIHEPNMTKYEESRWSYNKIIYAVANIWKELYPFIENDRVKIIKHHVGDFISNPYLIYRWLMHELYLNPNKYTEEELISKIKFDIDIKNTIQFIKTIENNYGITD